MNAQKYLLDNNCDDLILNDRFGMNPNDRIYASDIMEKYAKEYHESEVKKLNKGEVKSSSLRQFHIETQNDSGSFNFFTEALDHKKALKKLQTVSWDFRNLVKANRDFTITVKEV